MKEPRPAMISARPPERRSTVENCWKTRIGSSELKTETALVSRCFLSYRSGGKHGGRRGDGVIRTMMFAKAKDVQPHLIGKLDFLQQVLQPGGRILAAAAAGNVRIDIRKRVKAEFHDGQFLLFLGGR